MASICASTEQDLEILVIDDGSEDGSLAAAQKFREEYAGPCRIRVKSREHLGQVTLGEGGIWARNELKIGAKPLWEAFAPSYR